MTASAVRTIGIRTDVRVRVLALELGALLGKSFRKVHPGRSGWPESQKLETLSCEDSVLVPISIIYTKAVSLKSARES
jgi:hypothetical protein